MTPELMELAMRLRIAFAMIVRAQRQEVPERLTPVQIAALHKIECFGPVRLGELAASEQVAGPTMTRVVASLEEGELVTRRPDPTSGRCTWLTITARGRKQIDAVRRDRTNVLARRLAALTPDQRAALVVALPAIEALVALDPDAALAQREIERTKRATRGKRPA